MAMGMVTDTVMDMVLTKLLKKRSLTRSKKYSESELGILISLYNYRIEGRAALPISFSYLSKFKNSEKT
ncbi:hypothetical protein GCM10027051_32780 [Niabella terrae]